MDTNITLSEIDRNIIASILREKKSAYMSEANLHRLQLDAWYHNKLPIEKARVDNYTRWMRSYERRAQDIDRLLVKLNVAFDR